MLIGIQATQPDAFTDIAWEFTGIFVILVSIVVGLICGFATSTRRESNSLSFALGVGMLGSGCCAVFFAVATALEGTITFFDIGPSAIFGILALIAGFVIIEKGAIKEIQTEP